ncbi:hypothetical protein H4S02_006906, partial [Coemansia sp. RSA 2611]
MTLLAAATGDRLLLWGRGDGMAEDHVRLAGSGAMFGVDRIGGVTVAEDNVEGTMECGEDGAEMLVWDEAAAVVAKAPRRELGELEFRRLACLRSLLHRLLDSLLLALVLLEMGSSLLQLCRYPALGSFMAVVVV